MKNPTDHLGAPPAQARRKRAGGWKALGASLGVVVVLALVLHFSGAALLNRVFRPRLEQAFAAHLPGYSLRVGALRYDLWRNRLRCDGVVITRPDGAPASAGAMAATGVRWGRLLVGEREVAQILRDAQLEVTDLSAVVLAAEYRVACGHLRVSVPDAAIEAHALSLQLVGSEEAFFAATPFRRVRYRLTADACALRGVSFFELFGGQAYRARSLELTAPAVDSLVCRDKPPRPVTASPRMPHEALAAIARPFRIEQVTLTDGLIRYAARRFEGAEPGVLTFAAVQISAKDVANAAAGGEAIGLVAEGRLMDAGNLVVQMRIPVAPSTLAFRYAGKLSAMDLTRLDDYMEGSGRIQIASGNASEARFEIDVVDGHARGAVRGVYRDLQVKVVDGDTGSAGGVTNRIATILANQVTVRSENTPDKAGEVKAGKVDYARKPEETFLQFAWLALRSGVLDLISARASPSP